MASLREHAASLTAAAKHVNILIFDVERQRGEWRVEGWDAQPPKWLKPDWMTRRPRIMCFAAKWYGSDEVIFHDERGSNGTGTGGWRAMVKHLWSLMDEADVLVGWNSDKADIPWAKTEFKYAGLGKPMPAKSIDLFKAAKGEFASGMPSHSLRHHAKEFGSVQKLDTDGPDLWRLCLQGDPEAWALMEAYNRQDVLVTEERYNDMLPWLPGSTHMGVLIGDRNSMRCPNCGSTALTLQKKRARAYVREYEAYRCDDCGSPLRTNFLVGERQSTRPVR